MALFLGLISGTSMDGIDAALVEIGDTGIVPGACRMRPYPPKLRARLERLVHDDRLDSIAELGRLHSAVGRAFAEAALELLREAGVAPQEVSALGSHGQTIGHAPYGDEPFSLQLGDPSAIAFFTGIKTVADFRTKDIAAGGQGAPLVPPFHEAFFRRHGKSLAVVNVGGIANVTLFPADRDRPVLAFDCGPGNTLMDLWCRSEYGAEQDAGGSWAASGAPDPTLLATLLKDPYFALPPPKSTGRDYFHSGWIKSALEAHGDASALSAANVQATLAELTACTIASAIVAHLPDARDVIVCGGGAHNTYLMTRLRCALPKTTVETTASRGLDPDFVEAVAFAWLAYRRINGLAGNLPTVTGARRPVIMGGVYSPK